MTAHSAAARVAVPASAPLELRGRALAVARLVWVLLMTQGLALSAVAVPVRYQQLAHPPADVQAQLTQAGLPAALYAGYLTTISVLSALVSCGLAALIVRRRPHHWIGLLVSLYLVGGPDPAKAQALVQSYPGLALPASLSQFLGLVLLMALFFVFPDGRFVPGWARVPALVYGGAAIVLLVLTGPARVVAQPGWLGLMTALGGLAGIAAQIYRYVRVSDPVQRQQTKWVVLGVSCAMGASIIFTFFGSKIPSIGRPETGYDLTSVTVLTLAFLLIPLTVGVAILRYRLWDIDVVLNRALVYGALTVGLIGLYLLVVNGLGALLQARGRLSLPLSLIATALVAVLFAPVRGRLQTAVNRLMYGERDEPYRVLTRLAERAGMALAPEAVLPAITATVAQALKSPHAAITLQQTAAPTAFPHGVLLATALRVPISYQGERVGELLVAPRGPGEAFSPADRRLLADVARQIGPAAYAVRLTADLQRSRERLVTAREEERRRLRRDLHDGLGPQLAALTLKIETLRNRVAAEREIDAALGELTARTQAVLSDIRRLVYGLRPPALDELGLLAALGQAADQYNHQGSGRLQVTVDAPESLPPLPAAVEVAAYRIVQEALANVVRHAAASTCRLSVSLDDASHVLQLRIADNGRGLPGQYRAGVGMVSMRERAEELGGTCTIAALPSGGTAVTVALPCPPAKQDLADGNS